MSKSRAHRAEGPAATAKRAVLNAPRGLEAFTFVLGADEYALFAFPVEAVTAPEGLTDAERDIVRAVLAGHRNAEIARARGSVSNTVANQLQSIYRKLGVSSRRELIQICLPRAELKPSSVAG